jgi:hypothetical protein
VTAPIVLLAAVSLQGQQPAQPAPDQREGFRFKTGIELVNVTATVTDGGGRFVSGLTKEDFKVYEDEVLQTVSHFGASRVPVSLGIVLDASGSMDGEKIRAARSALEQFLDQLSDPEDEFFDGRPTGRRFPAPSHGSPLTAVRPCSMRWHGQCL